MRTAIALSALIAIPIGAATQGPLKVDALSFSEPATIATIDTEKLKGQPARLAWSPDASQLYLQTLEGNFGQAGAPSITTRSTPRAARNGTSGRNPTGRPRTGPPRAGRFPRMAPC